MTAAIAEEKPDGYGRGIVLVASAGMMWSLGGLFFRLIEDATVWQIVAWRTFFLATSISVLLVWRYRKRALDSFRRMGWWGLMGAFGIACANTLFMFSLQHTYVANTVLMLAAAPMLSAGLGWLLLRESIRPATVVAMVIVTCGVVVMVSGGLGTDRWLGDVLAILTVTGFALVVVAVRAGRETDMLPCVVVGAGTACVFATVMTLIGGEGLVVTPNDFFWCAMMGVVQMTGGMALFILGAKYVPAAELALLSLTEVIFGPIWVWLLLDEVPVEATFWGGAIVLVAIVVNAITGMRRKHPLPQV